MCFFKGPLPFPCSLFPKIACVPLFPLFLDLCSLVPLKKLPLFPCSPKPLGGPQLSSNVAKNKNIAILNGVLPVLSTLKLNSEKLLFMARPNLYKTRRQLVHCRIDVVTTRVQTSQTTRALSYRCRNYSKKCRSKPVKSWHYIVLCRSKSKGPVITRTMSQWSTEAKNTREPTKKSEMCTRTVRQSTGGLRDQYEKSSAHFGCRVVARFLNRLKISWALPDNVRDMATCCENSPHGTISLRLSYGMWRVLRQTRDSLTGAL